MPEISRFYGIKIFIYFGDHNPPHFHVKYGDHRAIIEIKTGAIISGNLPVKARILVEEWRILNIKNITKCWRSVIKSGVGFKIKGLE